MTTTFTPKLKAEKTSGKFYASLIIVLSTRPRAGKRATDRRRRDAIALSANSILHLSVSELHYLLTSPTAPHLIVKVFAPIGFAQAFNAEQLPAGGKRLPLKWIQAIMSDLVGAGERIHHSSTSIRLPISPLINPTDHKRHRPDVRGATHVSAHSEPWRPWQAVPRWPTYSCRVSPRAGIHRTH